MERIIEPVTPPSAGEGGAEAATADEDICAMAGCRSSHFNDLPSEDFLQPVI
jgi:hypothetical protein